MKEWEMKINLLLVLTVPIMAVALFKTWGTPLFWVLLVVIVKDWAFEIGTGR